MSSSGIFESHRTIHHLLSRFNRERHSTKLIQRVGGVDDLCGYIDFDATQSIDHLLKSFEIDESIMIDRNIDHSADFGSQRSQCSSQTLIT